MPTYVLQRYLPFRASNCRTFGLLVFVGAILPLMSCVEQPVGFEVGGGG